MSDENVYEILTGLPLTELRRRLAALNEERRAEAVAQMSRNLTVNGRHLTLVSVRRSDV